MIIIFSYEFNDDLKKAKTNPTKGDFMQKLILTACFLFTGALAMAGSSLILGQPITDGPHDSIQVYQDAGTVSLHIGAHLESRITQGNDWSLGAHVPYPVSELVFSIPVNSCIGGILHCVSQAPVPVEEVHVTGQRVPRQAAISYSITKSATTGVYNVHADVTDPNNNVLTYDLSLAAVSAALPLSTLRKDDGGQCHQVCVYMPCCYVSNPVCHMECDEK